MKIDYCSASPGDDRQAEGPDPVGAGADAAAAHLSRRRLEEDVGRA
jgi:hypothetical protein